MNAAGWISLFDVFDTRLGPVAQSAHMYVNAQSPAPMASADQAPDAMAAAAPVAPPPYTPMSRLSRPVDGVWRPPSSDQMVAYPERWHTEVHRAIGRDDPDHPIGSGHYQCLIYPCHKGGEFKEQDLVRNPRAREIWWGK